MSECDRTACDPCGARLPNRSVSDFNRCDSGSGQRPSWGKRTEGGQGGAPRPSPAPIVIDAAGHPGLYLGDKCDCGDLSKQNRLASQRRHIPPREQCPLSASSASSFWHARWIGCSPAELVVKGLLLSMGSRHSSQRSIAGSCGVVTTGSSNTGQLWEGPSRMRHSKP